MEMKPRSLGAEAMKNLDDCFFYYYSTCNRGSACQYRHEPAALNSETTCRFWILGNCTKPHCTFRHMEITAPRISVQCYFEQQPGGCRRANCTYLHRKETSRVDDSTIDEVFACATSPTGSPRSSCSPSPTPIPPHPAVIVLLSDLQDDDEEKLTPQHNLGRQTLSEERIQELKLIKNIQNEQADLLGYVLEDDDDGFYTGLGSIQQLFVDEVDNIVQDTQNSESTDQAPPSLPATPICSPVISPSEDTLSSVTVSSCESSPLTEERSSGSVVSRPPAVDRRITFDNNADVGTTTRPVRYCERRIRKGGVASVILAETLGTKPRLTSNTHTSGSVPKTPMYSCHNEEPLNADNDVYCNGTSQEFVQQFTPSAYPREYSSMYATREGGKRKLSTNILPLENSYKKMRSSEDAILNGTTPINRFQPQVSIAGRISSTWANNIQNDCLGGFNDRWRNPYEGRARDYYHRRRPARQEHRKSKSSEDFCQKLIIKNIDEIRREKANRINGSCMESGKGSS
ncbi:uncharacterized protein LOC108671915 [Hyalella azteca]|uniref:Uncharacterized protein LOC108671915 n=1 Tax=Hyalella azteca TaxID=294128 RepID=A0A8B7NMU8_HYAAZ|nr:uncharacterized protein LOC108671915 [Hyalella azteca]